MLLPLQVVLTSCKEAPRDNRQSGRVSWYLLTLPAAVVCAAPAAGGADQLQRDHQQGGGQGSGTGAIQQLAGVTVVFTGSTLTYSIVIHIG